MKRLLLPILPFLFIACSMLPVDDGGQSMVDTASTVTGGIVTTATGNPALGAAVGVLVGAVGGWFVTKRKKAATA